MKTRNEIFSFANEEDQQNFITDLKLKFPEVEYSTRVQNSNGLAPDTDRLLVAVKFRMEGNA
jgi:hypothetical protein